MNPNTPTKIFSVVRYRRTWLFVGALFVSGCATLALFALFMGSQLIRPVNRPVPIPAGFHAQTVSIPARGHSSAGWWIDQGRDAPVVLLLHGVRATRASMVGRANLLTAHGFSVLMIDLQAHGETPGEAITMGLRESEDARAALDWIRKSAPSRRVGVVGSSLGGASVLLGPQPAGFDAVVLEAVYPSISAAVENRMRIRFGPLAPFFAPLLLAQLRPRLGVSPSQLEPIRFIDEIQAPVLVVAGSRDRHTTLADSEALFRAAAEPKRIWVVKGAAHEDFLKFDPQGYESEVIGFLSERLKPAPATITD